MVKAGQLNLSGTLVGPYLQDMMHRTAAVVGLSISWVSSVHF